MVEHYVSNLGICTDDKVGVPVQEYVLTHETILVYLRRER